MKTPAQLVPLFESGVITNVVRPLMAGKEASVYVVESEGELRAAKVYKTANERSFRQRAQYSEGRTVRNSRQRRAMAKGSKYGKSLLEAAWQNAEVDWLFRLHAAGVRVPVPYHFSDDVLVMELVTDVHGEPAPRLYDIRPTPEEADALHAYLIRQVVLMLCQDMVHGDLSEFNILMSGEGPVVIDLPQACDAAQNRNAAKLLKRDVKNLAMYLGRFSSRLKGTRFGPEMWDLYEAGKLFPDTELTGKKSRKASRTDTDAVLEEIAAAAAEAHDKPLSAYAAKKEKKRQENIAALAAERERLEERQARRKEQAERNAERAASQPQPTDAERPPRSRRRRNRKRGGGRSEGGPPRAERQRDDRPKAERPRQDRPTGAGNEPASGTGGGAPKRRRRRRRKRPGGAGGTGTG